MKKSLLALCLASLVFGSCGRDKISSPQNPSEASIGAALAGIKTAEVTRRPIAREVKMAGQVSLLENGQASIVSPSSGVIASLLTRAGERVRQGDPLAVVNTIYGQTPLAILQKIEQDEVAASQAKDNQSQARAELANARIELRRKKLLFSGGVAAGSDVQDAEERYQKALSVAQDTRTLLAVARTALLRDQSIYRQTRLSGSPLRQNLTPVPLESGGYSPRDAAASVSFYIRSPIGGTVDSITMTPGLSVSPGTVLGTIVNTGRIYVDAHVYESDLPFVHPGDRVSVESSAYPSRRFGGTLKYIGQTVDPATRTLTARSLIVNPHGLLRSGMFVSASVSAGKPEIGLVVPENAVLIHGSRRYIFIETAPGRYEKRIVQVGIQAGGHAEIISGAREGEKVVVDGNLLLEAEE